MGNIEGHYNPATGMLTLTSENASATVEQWQAALRTVRYSNRSSDPSTINRTVSFVVSDGGTTSSAPANKTVNVTVVNQIYTVQFDSNGGSATVNQSIANNHLAAVPSEPIRAGYRFAGWFTDHVAFEQPFDFAHTPITRDIQLYARWIKEASIGLSVESLGGTVYGNLQSYAYGDRVSVTARPDEGYRFVSWDDVETGKRLSTQGTYSFFITAQTSLKARFEQIQPHLFVVTFVSESGQILSIQSVSQGENAVPPPSPSKPDAEFLDWSADYTNIQADMTLRPMYSERTKLYRLTVQAGTTHDGQTDYPFDTKVTVVAEEATEAMQFSHWAKSGNIVSYEQEYTFFITGDTELTAIYVSTPTIKAPIVDISPHVIANPSLMRMSFIGQVDLPASFTLVECGLVVKKSDVPVTDLHIGTEQAIKARSSSQTGTGQYMMNKTGVASGETWYATAYLIYKDADGEVFTIYSEIVSGLMP